MVLALRRRGLAVPVRLPLRDLRPLKRERFPWGLTLAVALLLPLLIALGVWQVRRLAWKQDLLARIEAVKTAPARPLGQVLEQAGASGQSAGFAKATVYCAGIATAPYVELQSIMDGQPGVRLISPCRTADGALLVDRGFVAEVSARPPVAPSGDVLSVTGVLRDADRPGPFTPAPRAGRFYGRDIPAMARALKVESPLPYMLVAETSTNPGWRALRPAPLPGDIPNNHLGYALTWFGLAAALAATYAGMLLSRRRRRTATTPPSLPYPPSPRPR
ncbi:MAG TPA: SURF1 family protein [Caulobacteraceae bacterium]